jgi:hypothetical protein
MKLKDKLGVAAIFALGFFVVISSSTHASSPHDAQSNGLYSHPRLLLQT